MGTLAGRMIPRAQLLRPYPQFDGVASQQAAWASSTYHSLQARAEKRYASGLYVLVSYTYSKFLDYGTGPFGGETLGGGSFRTINNPQCGMGVFDTRPDSPHDRQHGLRAAVLPEGEGRVENRVRRMAVRRHLERLYWRTAWHDINVNNTFSQGGGQRPNWNGQKPVRGRPDAAALAGRQRLLQSPAPIPLAMLLGRSMAAAAMASTNRRHPYQEHAIRRALECPVPRRVVQHHELGAIQSAEHGFGNPQFGIVNSQANLPRIIQFGLKLMF